MSRKKREKKPKPSVAKQQQASHSWVPGTTRFPTRGEMLFSAHARAWARDRNAEIAAARKPAPTVTFKRRRHIDPQLLVQHEDEP